MIYECEITQELLDIMIDVTMLTPLGKKQLRGYRIRCLSGALLLIILALILGNTSGIIALIGATVLILFTLFGAKKVFKNSLKKAQQKQDTVLLSGFRRYIFSENNVMIESSVGKSEFTWDAFSYYMEYKHYIFISMKDNRALIVDKDKVLNCEPESFLALLNSKIKCESSQK